MSPWGFVEDLLDPDLGFLPLALVGAVLASVLCSVVGTYVVLRGMAFIGDAVAHGVLPGLAVAFVLSGNLLVGGAVAGVLTAAGIALLAQNRRLRDDTVIGVLLAGAFALGIVVIARAPGYAGSLQQLLLGSVTGLGAADLAVLAVTTVTVAGVLQVLHPRIVAVMLDRESARALGLPVALVEVTLYLLVAAAVVVSVQIVGNIAVLALLVTPAATARLLSERWSSMIATAVGVGALSAVLGTYLSWAHDLPVGACVVLVATSAFLLAWLAAPRHGVLAGRWGARVASSST